MQTPYLVIDKRWPDFVTPEAPPHRCTVRHETSRYLLLLFPPDTDFERPRLEQRVHSQPDSLRYEDGFMLDYPHPYLPCAADKLELFERPSIELDGFFSRLCVDGDRLTIDGSAMYLQTLCSHESPDRIAFSNNLQLMESALRANSVELTRNELFFANHLFNYSLAYHASAGTPWEQIRFHDSLETIVLEGEVRVELRHKLASESFSALSREQRIELLGNRLRHAIAQYRNYLGVETVGHNLTGGRDSRTSFALFLELSPPEQLEVVTNGLPHTQDCVLSNHIARRFGLAVRQATEGDLDAAFDYGEAMRKPDLLEWMTMLYKKMRISTKFDSGEFVANGYLGNVSAFDGGEKNLIITDNRFGMDENVERRLRESFEHKIAALATVYGDRAHAMFNVMYNTINKVESVVRRLSSNTFSIFEFDVFQMCYAAETPEQRRSGALHYELLRRSSPELLRGVPFETNKSFEAMPDSYELVGSTDSIPPVVHRVFLARHLHRVVDHLHEHRDRLGFMADRFFELLTERRDQELPPLFANKIYAALGTLEFQGVSLGAPGERLHLDGPDFYSRDFFERFSADRAIWASGLPGMVYSREVLFKSYVTLPSSKTLRIVVREANGNKIVPVDMNFEMDGCLVRARLPRSGKYRVNFSEIDSRDGTSRLLRRLTFVAKGVCETHETSSTRALGVNSFVAERTAAATT